MPAKNTWAVTDDLSRADLGDKRLNARLRALTGALVAAPQASLPHAMVTEAALEGAYRFFRNPRVTSSKILAPHIEQTAQRARSHDVVYCVSDTTELRFGGTSRKGLGPLQNGGQGFLEHVSIAVAGDGSRLPLGVLAHKTIVRPPQKKGRSGTTASRQAKDSESLKWMEVVEAAEAAVDCKGRLVHVCDREADIYASLVLLHAHSWRYVLRIAQNRAVVEDGEVSRLFDALKDAPVITTRNIQVRVHKRGADGGEQRYTRTARLAISAISVELRRAKAASASLPKTLQINVVHVHEIDTPEGEDPVDWKLATSEPIKTAEQVDFVVSSYQTRWVIEEFFKALKTGCDFEANQLETFGSIQNLLAVTMPVAIQVLALRSLAQSEPEAPAERVLTNTEIEALRLMSHRRLPEKLTVHDAMYGIAGMGGHIKRNGPPGWLVLSRGYLKLTMQAAVLDKLKLASRSDQS